MIVLFTKIVFAGSVMLATLGFFNASGAAESSAACEPETGRVVWKRLTYQGKHFLGKVETTVSLVELSTLAAQKVLISIPDGSALQASTARVMVLDVQSAVDPLFGATDISGSRAWFTSDDAAALQRIRSRRGDDIWQNTYRFTKSGVYRQRRKPGRTAENKLTPEHWTKIKESFYPYLDTVPDSHAVLEPTGLLYFVSGLDFRKQTTPQKLYVFDRKQLHLVNVYASGSLRIKGDYLRKTMTDEVRKQEIIDAIRISFEPHALSPQGAQPEEFSFLGLKGKFEIYIDSTSRIPVQVTGTIKGPGKVSLKLREVELVR